MKEKVGKALQELRIELAIQELKLQEEEIKVISYKNMEKICEMAKVNILDLMEYLRYER